MARTGFVLFGLAVMWIAAHSHQRWGELATALHLVFAVCMIGVAAYSQRSWMPGAEYDQTEDLLHSVAATVMGFAFAFGVVALAVQLRASGRPWRVLDAVAVVASVVLPIGMSIYGATDGTLQRIMFAIAYLWYGREAAATSQRSSY